jgi:hypothetical protein
MNDAERASALNDLRAQMAAAARAADDAATIDEARAILGPGAREATVVRTTAGDWRVSAVIDGVSCACVRADARAAARHLRDWAAQERARRAAPPALPPHRDDPAGALDPDQELAPAGGAPGPAGGTHAEPHATAPDPPAETFEDPPELALTHDLDAPGDPALEAALALFDEEDEALEGEDAPAAIHGGMMIERDELSRRKLDLSTAIDQAAADRIAARPLDRERMSQLINLIMLNLASDAERVEEARLQRIRSWASAVEETARAAKAALAHADAAMTAVFSVDDIAWPDPPA